jgi:hypothetical protein
MTADQYRDCARRVRSVLKELEAAGEFVGVVELENAYATLDRLARSAKQDEKRGEGR